MYLCVERNDGDIQDERCGEGQINIYHLRVRHSENKMVEIELSVVYVSDYIEFVSINVEAHTSNIKRCR